MVFETEREDGEVTDDEEEYLPVAQKRCTNKTGNETPNIEDLRLAVFRSVVERKLTERKVEGDLAFNSHSFKTKCAEEFDENDGSSSDMEVETWDSNHKAVRKSESHSIALNSSDTIICKAISSSIHSAVDELSTNLEFESSMTVSENRNVLSVVFFFKENEQIDSFGLALKEQTRRKKAKSSVANGTAGESQRLSASFSFWSDEIPNELYTAAANRSSDLGSLAQTGSCVDVSNLAVLPMEYVPSGVSACSTKSEITKVTHTLSRNADGRTRVEESLKAIESASTIPLTAAQQRMKMVEDIARLKLEILLREKKNRVKDNGATNLKDFSKMAQASWFPLANSSKEPLPIVSGSDGTNTIFNTSANMAILQTPDNLGLLAVPISPHCSTTSAHTLTSISQVEEDSTAFPVMGQSQTEEALRAAALISRKKRPRDETVPHNVGDSTAERRLSLARAAIAPSLSVPAAAPHIQHQHTLYPSSRTRLGSSLLGSQHMPLAAAVLSPLSNFQKPPTVMIAPCISSSSTFGQNRRYVPTRTSSEDAPTTTTLYSTLMGIGAGLRAPPAGPRRPRSRSSSEHLTAEKETKGLETSLKVKQLTESKNAADFTTTQSSSGAPPLSETRSACPQRVNLMQSSGVHRAGDAETLPVSLNAGLSGIGGSNGLDYSYGQHDSLSELLCPPEDGLVFLEKWFGPPDLGSCPRGGGEHWKIKTDVPLTRGGAAFCYSRSQQAVSPAAPSPVQPSLSEDLIQRVRRLQKQQKLRSANTVASVSTDSELEFGEIFETHQRTDSSLVTPHDLDASDSDTDMLSPDVVVDVEVGAASPSVRDPAAQCAGSADPEGLSLSPTVDEAAATCDSNSMGSNIDYSGSSGAAGNGGCLQLLARSDSLCPSSRDTRNPIASDPPDILVGDNPVSYTDSDVAEESLPIMVLTSSYSASNSVTEMRSLRLREAELKVC